MKGTVLVISTVHAPDDTRIRERLIRTLAMDWDVVYAVREPGPSDTGCLTWKPLKGGRVRRNLAALNVALLSRWDIAVVHDPELVVIGVLARLIRRRPVVFDVHEDLAAQLSAKEWIPKWSLPFWRLVARVLYGLAERMLVLTLAEDQYSALFRRPHPVFVNFPRSAAWQGPAERGNGTAVYLGDVQKARGVIDAVRACGSIGVPLVVIGPVSDRLQETLRREAGLHGTDLKLAGRLPNPEAIEVVARASVGLSPLKPLPNYLDSLPTKTLEYLAAGIPVVASDLPGTRSVLDGLAAVVLVQPGDVGALASGIRRAMSEDFKDAAVRQARHVRRDFRWPDEEVQAFYREHLSR